VGAHELAQLNGAYWPLLRPLVSFHDRPNTPTTLRIARANQTVVFAGCPVFASWSGDVVRGSRPMAGAADMLTNVDACTDHFAPSCSKRIGVRTVVPGSRPFRRAR